MQPTLQGVINIVVVGEVVLVVEVEVVLVVLVVVDIFSVRELMGGGVVNVITTGGIVLVVGILKIGGELGVVGMGQ